MTHQGNDRPAPGRTSRRRMLQETSGALAALGAVAIGGPAAAAPVADTVIKNGRIKQSIVYWCFEKYFDMPRMIEITKQLGCGSIELVEPKYFPMLKQAGLECAIGTIDMGGEPPFVKGFNNPKYHEQVIRATVDAIDACAEFGFKQVICFTGFADGICSAEVGGKELRRGVPQDRRPMPRRRGSCFAWRCSTRATRPSP